MLSHRLRRAARPAPFFISDAFAQASATSSVLQVTMPEYEVGDFCVIHFNKATSGGTLTTPSGFTLDASETAGNALYKTVSKTLTSSDGSVNLAYTGDSSTTRAIRYSIIIFRGVEDYAFGNSGVVTTVTPSAPLVSVPWSSNKKMAVFYSGITRISGNADVTSVVSGYTYIHSANQQSAAFRIFSTSQNETPGSWGTYAVSADWVVVTYALRGF
jgi:hypothetical protein